MIHLAVQQFARSSGGGLVANTEFLEALPAVPDCTFSTFQKPAQISAAADVIICMGTHAVRSAGKKTLLWPLTVAPLDAAAVRLGSTSIGFTLRYRLLKFKVWNSLRKADGLIFGSQYSRDLHREFFPRIMALPTLAMRPGVPPPEALQNGPRSEQVPGRVVMISHLYPYKMIVEAIRGFQLFSSKFPGAELLIAGRATDPNYLKQVQHTIDGFPGIRILGSLKPDELAKLYSSASVVLFNSLCENAGSLTAFDALWFGRAMVCSSRSSMPEAMQNAVHYVNPSDPTGIADALQRVLRDDEYRRSLEHRALERAAQFQPWPRRAAEVVAFCRSVAGIPDAVPAKNSPVEKVQA